MRLFLLTIVSFVFYLKVNTASDPFCNNPNTAFNSGERFHFVVYYTLGVYIAAGEADFSITTEKYNGKTVYHLLGTGRSYSFYDNFFRVRDRYESYVDTATFTPLKFIRNVSEGNTKKYENISFNKSAGTAVTNNGVYKIPSCTQDIMTALYNARNIDYDKYKVNDKIPVTIFLENELHNLYIRYMGKEKIKTKFGTFNSIKLKPLLMAGTVFNSGENMTVWISDDDNHIPIRLESSIAVGSIKIDMMSYSNLRNPVTSLIKQR